MIQPTDNRLRPRIERALDYLPDEMLAEVCEESAIGAEADHRPPSKRRSWIIGGTLAASLALIMSGMLLLFGLLGNVPIVPEGSTTTIVFDVNPSLSMEVNTEDRVIAVTALNEDADAVVSELDVLEAPLDEAIDAVIAALLRHGYLMAEQSTILISVDAADSERSDTIRRRVVGVVSACLAQNDARASVITQAVDRDETRVPTPEEGTSAVKEAYIQRILETGLRNAYGDVYTYELLASLTVNDLMLIWRYKGLTTTGLTRWEKDQIIVPEKALSIVVSDSGMEAAQIREPQIELDYLAYLQCPVYQVGFLADGVWYEYDLLAMTGDILSISPVDQAATDPPPETFSPTTYISPRSAQRVIRSELKQTYEINLSEIPVVFQKRDGVFVYHSVIEYEGMRYEYVLDAINREIISEKITVQSE